MIALVVSQSPRGVRRFYLNRVLGGNTRHINEVKRVEEDIRRVAYMVALILLCMALAFPVLSLVINKARPDQDRQESISKEEVEREYLKEVLERHEKGQ